MASSTPPAHTPHIPVLHNIPQIFKPNQWQYNGDKRDLRLDLLRGFAVVTMVIDHMGGGDSWLYVMSGGDRFFVSAAEGFVFISGLVMGIVYASVIARQGLRAAMLKGLKRVGTLYGLTVVLSLLFAAVSARFNLPWALQLNPSGLVDFVTDVLTLHGAFYLTDVLLLYTLVIAAALPALALMRHGYTWLVLAGSWALWAAWQWWPDASHLPWTIEGGTTFNFAPWQVLFMTGLVIGYHRKALEDRFSRLFSMRARVSAQVAALFVSSVLFGGSIALYFWLSAHPTDTILGLQVGQMFGKPDLRVGRVVLFACIFTFAFMLTTLAWKPLRKLTGWLLLPLGQSALAAYTLHLFVLALAAKVSARVLGAEPYSTLENTLVQAAAICLILVALLLKAPAGAFVRDTYRRTRRWMYAVLPAGVGAWYKSRVRSARLRLRVVRSPGESRVAGASVMVLVLAAVVFVSAGPSVARALRNNPVEPNVYAAPGGTTMASSDATEVAKVSGEAAPDFAIFMSGTAVPSPVASPTDPPLPSYVLRRTFQSASLGRTMPYYIFLPPDYNANPNTRYPVLYMLHGISGTYNEWLGYGLLGRARDMMLAGQISPFIIVLPQGDVGYWVDHAGGGPMWGTYVVRDVVSEIDTNFRTLADRDHRAIGGLSMGGSGALQLAINYPDVFGTVGAHSPSLHDYADAPPFYGDEQYFNEHDPVYLYNEHPDVAKTLKIWIDDGEDDNWLPVLTNFHQMLLDNGVAHEWHVFPGAHAGEYWATYVLDYLLFYNSALNSGSTPTPVPSPTSTPSPTNMPLPTPLPILSPVQDDSYSCGT